MPKRPVDLPEDAPKDVQVVNLLDSRGICLALDDKVAELMDADLGYAPDQKLSNVKIALGLSAIACAIAVHVIPVPFPENIWILVCGCAGYIFFSGLMQLVISYVECYSGSLIFMSQPDAKGQRIRITRMYGAYSPEYKLVVDLLSREQSAASSLRGVLDMYRTRKTLASSTHTSSIGQFFDDRGILYVPGLEKVLREGLAVVNKKRQ